MTVHGPKHYPFGRIGKLRYDEVILTDAQIKNLEATPVELAVRPGVGRFLEFVCAILLRNFAVGYDATNSALRVKYANAAGVVVSTNILDTPAFFSLTDEGVLIAYPTAIQQANHVVATKAQAENQSLVARARFYFASATWDTWMNCCPCSTIAAGFSERS